jgi:hypothetical protein
MKKTVVLDEKLEDTIQRTRGEVLTRTGKDVSFSKILNFFAWQGMMRLYKLDEDALGEEIRRGFSMLDQEIDDIEESMASLWDKVREKVERG